MPQTYTPIATFTMTGSTGTVNFTSIPQTFTDLILVMQGGADSAANKYNWMQYNSDTGTNYSTTQLWGNGTTTGSLRWTNRSNINMEYNSFPTTDLNCIHIAQIQNYSNTTTYKTCLIRAGRATAATEITVGIWRSTTAITSIKVESDTSNYQSGSTLTLYGIKAA